MSEPVRITKNATASDLAETLGWIGEEIQKRATDQAREDIADALRDQFIDRSNTYVKHSDTPTDSIINALRLSKETKATRFQDLVQRFDEDGISADFRLGLEFAIAMIRDSEFEL